MQVIDGSAAQLKIVAMVLEERARQQDKWDKNNEEQNTINDWIAFIARYVGMAQPYKILPGDVAENVRINFIKAAALIVAALEEIEEKESTGVPIRVSATNDLGL